MGDIINTVAQNKSCCGILPRKIRGQGPWDSLHPASDRDQQTWPRSVSLSIFVEGLTNALRCWRAAGDRLILFIDSNEHVLTGRLAGLFAHPSIDMHEASHAFWNKGMEHNTHINGTKPINGVYASPEIDVQSFLALSFHEGVGDHRTSIIDVTTASMIGMFQGHIVRPTSRRLTTKQSASVASYNSVLWEQLKLHNIPQRWETVAEDASHYTGVVPHDVQLRAE